ncbi:MAG: sigma-54 factor interaction domain-containing protein, partial [Nitrospirota bacterium]
MKLRELIGSSAPMREVLDMIRLVADSSATVLIEGESGTGKELVAKAIRQSRPCKGTFTGAYASKRGLFEEADGGTISLDDIADTTPVFQSKQLCVLQEGAIKPVGGTQAIKIDAQVISATNKDLSELVKAKMFRQDLYYRLAVLPLHVPPLRERRED